MALVKAGSVWKKKDGTGMYIALGDSRNKNPDFNYSVEVIVKNAKGEVVASQTDGFLTILDPRKSPKANLDALAKVPNLRSEIFVATPDKE